ncbi:MAG: hypothetical protein V3T17_10940 [Pseudomonadales bacterium]
MQTDLKANMLKILNKIPIGMTRFQLKHFVIGDQNTHVHRIRQVVNEIDVREVNAHKSDYKAKKAKLALALLEETLARDKDTLSAIEIELRELEIENDRWKLISLARTRRNSQTELSYLYDILQELIVDVDVDELLDNFDHYDEVYWSRRLGKQAAVDMATQGRISAGNLAAIELMPEGLKQKTLLETVSLANDYSGDIQRQINCLEKQAKPKKLSRVTANLVEAS